MPTPEGRVKLRVSALLRSYGVYYCMPVQAGYGRPLLDYYGCLNGLFFAVETKAQGKKPTPRQEVTMQDIRRAGGTVFVVSTNEDLATLEAWIRRHTTAT